MTLDPASDIKFGLPIYTIDGEKIGTVKDLYGDYIRVSPTLWPDFWVSRKYVQSFTAERVTLMFEKAHLGDYKEPAPEGYKEQAA